MSAFMSALSTPLQLGQSFRKNAFIGLGPLVAWLLILSTDLSPGNPEVTRMAAVALWMAIWWLTEAVPLAVTALLPVILLPFLGIMGGSTVAAEYFNSIIFLFLGGFMIALAMERWNLHKRIALSIIRLIGVSPQRLYLGFMAACGFLSMWMSNTATTMMMMPIALAVILELEDNADSDRQRERVRKFAIGLLLGVAYAASIGGIATIIGTPPNIAFVQMVHEFFPAAPEISFAGWMLYALPLSLIMMASTWFLLTRLYCCPGKNGKTSDAIADPELFHQQQQALGEMKTEERWILGIFVITALLWMTRSDIQAGNVLINGWGDLFSVDGKAFVDDGTVAMLMASLLFVIPSSTSGHGRLMRWEDMARLPWGIVLLFGGGFALAAGMQASGLSLWLGERLSGLAEWPPLALVITLSGFMTVFTEFASNIASVQMILPILASTAVAIHINPLLLMIPATACASFGFMLPVATAPNAIVFGTNRLRMMDMVKAGICLDLIGIVATVTLMFILGIFVFGIDLNTMPGWAQGLSAGGPTP